MGGPEKVDGPGGQASPQAEQDTGSPLRAVLVQKGDDYVATEASVSRDIATAIVTELTDALCVAGDFTIRFPNEPSSRDEPCFFELLHPADTWHVRRALFVPDAPEGGRILFSNAVDQRRADTLAALETVVPEVLGGKEGLTVPHKGYHNARHCADLLFAASRQVTARELRELGRELAERLGCSVVGIALRVPEGHQEVTETVLKVISALGVVELEYTPGTPNQLHVVCHRADRVERVVARQDELRTALDDATLEVTASQRDSTRVVIEPRHPTLRAYNRTRLFERLRKAGAIVAKWTKSDRVLDGLLHWGYLITSKLISGVVQGDGPPHPSSGAAKRGAIGRAMTALLKGGLETTAFDFRGWLAAYQAAHSLGDPKWEDITGGDDKPGTRMRLTMALPDQAEIITVAVGSCPSEAMQLAVQAFREKLEAGTYAPPVASRLPASPASPEDKELYHERTRLTRLLELHDGGYLAFETLSRAPYRERVGIVQGEDTLHHVEAESPRSRRLAIGKACRQLSAMLLNARRAALGIEAPAGVTHANYGGALRRYAGKLGGQFQLRVRSRHIEGRLHHEARAVIVVDGRVVHLGPAVVHRRKPNACGVSLSQLYRQVYAADPEIERDLLAWVPRHAKKAKEASTPDPAEAVAKMREAVKAKLPEEILPTRVVFRPDECLVVYANPSFSPEAQDEVRGAIGDDVDRPIRFEYVFGHQRYEQIVRETLPPGLTLSRNPAFYSEHNAIRLEVKGADPTDPRLPEWEKTLGDRLGLTVLVGTPASPSAAVKKVKADSDDIVREAIDPASLPGEIPPPPNPATMKDAEITGDRVDLTELRSITIDPAGAGDHDDAISIEHLDDGRVRLGIHIADVAALVPPDSAIARQARERAETVYGPSRIIPMLPPEITFDEASLVEGKVRWTRSVLVTFDATGAVENTEIVRSAIRVNAALSYDQADAQLRRESGAQHNDLAAIQAITTRLRSERVDSDAFASSSPSARIVEECMLLANRRVAEETEGIPYRVHEGPSSENVDALRGALEQMGLQDLGDALVAPGRAHDAVKRLWERAQDDPSLAFATEWLRTHVNRAEYQAEASRHHALGFDRYTHFTSPIRRYADLLVHWRLDEAESGTPARESLPPILRQHNRRCRRVERRAAELAGLERLVERSQAIGREFDGVLTQVGASGATVAIPGLGASASVEGDITTDTGAGTLTVGKTHIELAGAVRVRVTGVQKGTGDPVVEVLAEG